MLCQDIMHLFSEGTLVAVVPEYVDLIYCAMGPGFNIWSNAVLIKTPFLFFRQKFWDAWGWEDNYRIFKKEKHHTRLKCDSNELTYTFLI